MIEKYKYKIIFEKKGGSLEVFCNSDKELHKALKDFYTINKNNGFKYNAKIYNEQNEDISESQYIESIVLNIIYNYKE